MIGAKSTLTVTGIKLSNVLGALEYRKVGKPYENKNTGETTTKITVLSDKENDMYEVTCQGAIEEGTYQKGQDIDFDNCSLRFSASGAKGFNVGDVNGILNVAIRAEKIIDLREKPFPNEQIKNVDETKSSNDKKQQNKSL